MRRVARVIVLGLAAALVCGCDQTRVIGHSCPRTGCAASIPPPEGCGVQLRTEPELIEPGATRERCQLFTLDRLAAPEQDGRVYLTAVETRLISYTQDLDLRLAPEIDGFEDGPVDCAQLRTRAIAWLPLMTTHHDHDSWDFTEAPLVASRSYRLLVNDSYANSSSAPVEASVTINVHCASRVPAIVSQSFEFANREPRVVAPHERITVFAPCAFSKDVLVSRLYRRTRRIRSFSVLRLSDGESVWSSDLDWIRDLDPALRFMANDGMRWECTYENNDDVSFSIGGKSSDECVLLGLYRLPDGSRDPFPEHCTR